jgi:LacI family transcriptional regulator
MPRNTVAACKIAAVGSIVAAERVFHPMTHDASRKPGGRPARAGAKTPVKRAAPAAAGKTARKKIDSVDIARLVGVARSTVSKVLNGYPHIAPETRARILQAVRTHQYRPNLSAQILAGKKSNTLGLFFINQGHFSEDVLADFMISSLIENAATFGYHTLAFIIRNPDDADTCASIAETFYQRRIDGGVFIGARNREPVIEALVAEGQVVGVFDQTPAGRHEPNRVVANFDDARTAASVIDYLARLGHRDIAVIHGDRKRNAGVLKHQGFMQGMKAHGLPIVDQWMLSGDFQSEGGYRAMAGLLRDAKALPTAVATVNDNTAFGAMRAIAEAGLRVPEDISIVGIDGHPFCAYARPPLTTFEYDFQEMMHGLISSVVGVVTGREGEVPLHQVFLSRLVERESCRPCR